VRQSRIRRFTPSRELCSFLAIGLACTVAFAVLYAVLRAAGLAPLAANALALACTMGANFAANRHLTFRAADAPLLPQLAGYAVAYALGLGASSIVLAGLEALLGRPDGALDTAAALLSGVAATAVRFVLMRGWVFRPRTAAPAQSAARRYVGQGRAAGRDTRRTGSALRRRAREET
jgi:putative flippase GtrA